MRLGLGLLLCVVLPVAAAADAVSELKAKVVAHYADVAHAGYEDALLRAQQLQQAVQQFLAEPTPAKLLAARQSWLRSRVPYGQTEGFRFGNANVDDWEGQVNAWPLDEGLIDYVAGDHYVTSDGNAEYGHANVIADARRFPTIDVALLRETLHEAGAEEANVATGYHAIEFLLWGQDLNVPATASGERPATDFALDKQCTSGAASSAVSLCERRRRYLQVVTDLLVTDLAEMVADWAPGVAGNYRAALLSAPLDDGLRRILVGMGSLSLGELASQRVLVALLAQDQEEEHSCFSDNTHVDIWANALSVKNIYLGEYRRIDGTELRGPGISDLVAAADAGLDKTLRTQLADSVIKADAIVVAAEAGEHFDQQIGQGNKEGNARVRAVVDALVAQTGSLELAARRLGIDGLDIDRGSQF